MSTQIVPLEQMNTMAQAISASGLFNLKTPEQVLALMIVAQSEGRHPGAVARDYHIMTTRDGGSTPVLKADAILARFQEAGGRVEWHELNDKIADASFTHPAGGTVRIDWTMERAKRANLNSPNWQKYPRAMLRARTISEGVRTVYPAVLCGMYTPEEAEDFDDVKPPREKDVTPPKQEKPKATFEQCLEYIHRAKDKVELDKFVGRASSLYPEEKHVKSILEARAMRMEELGIPLDTVSGASPKPEKVVEQEGIGKELLQTILNGINGADTLDRLESDYSAGMDVCRSAKDRASAGVIQKAYKERLKVIENQQVIEGEVVV